MKLSEAFLNYRLVMGQRIKSRHGVMVALVSGKVSKELDALLTAESELCLAIEEALKGLETEIKELSPKAIEYIALLPRE